MRVKITILMLVLASLACLQTVIPGGTFTIEEGQNPACVEPICSIATEDEPESGAVYEPTAESQMLKATCAIVTATRSLWIRQEPSEKSAAISWLHTGDIVTVIGRVGDWWKIEAADATGYARADYLSETECE